jgi:GalNAc-alpha-(1->4)-GalNAc-alpha-(1->3)-diNAcBac-PP-undecaprenol alpha-1,4-N-acetyl-D-galactosaminyltransferase
MHTRKKQAQQFKIALILPTLHAGGMERVMSELANYFVLLPNIEVHFILFKKNATMFYPLHEKVAVHKQGNGFLKQLKFFEFFYTLFYIRKTVSSIAPDSVLSFGTQWNNLVLLSLFGKGFPVFVSDRGSPARRYQALQEWLRSWLYPKATGIIAQTRTAQQFSEGRFKHHNIAVIGNPIKRVVGNGERKKAILTVGRLIESKHHDRLIHIFSKLNAPEWELIIVGDDALKQNNMVRLNKLVEELGLAGKVALLGARKDVDRFYLSSKIFAFTSSVEGFPNVVGEAMSAGLPVVSYDCNAGPSEMIKDGKNGYLIKQFDDDAFVEKLQHLVDNPILVSQMAIEAIETMEQFSLQTIGNKYLKFLLPAYQYDHEKAVG